jgi:DNA-binding NarL/FixJ family response regulator
MTPLRAETPGTIAVLVADSNRMQAQLLAGALRRRSEFRVATCLLEPVSILHAVSSRFPKVALLSLNSAASLAESMAVLRHFHLSHAEVFKVLLVEASDRNTVVSAFRSGARGIFCLPKAGLRDLSKCIQRVAGGQIWANTEQMNYLLDLITEVPSLRVLNSGGDPLLTPREEQVVALVAEGLGNREIARELKLSEHTVKKYLFRVFEKLGISTRVELVLYALNHGAPRHAEWMAGSTLLGREV